MNRKMRQQIKICTRVALFCTPIVFLVCGIIIEREAFVIGGAMGILLAFIISILTEFHERQLLRRQSVSILVSSSQNSMRNITIEIMSHADELPDDTSKQTKKGCDDIITGAPKEVCDSNIEVVCDKI
jgi:hypothetical protein